MEAERKVKGQQDALAEAQAKFLAAKKAVDNSEAAVKGAIANKEATDKAATAAKKATEEAAKAGKKAPAGGAPPAGGGYS